jgi:transposase
MPTKKKQSSEAAVREIRRRARRRFSAEEKIRIVLEGLCGEESIAALCRREGIVSNLYFRWSKEFLEAGKKRLAGGTMRDDQAFEAGGVGASRARQKGSISDCAVAGTPGGTPPWSRRFAGRSGKSRVTTVRLALTAHPTG